MKNIHELLKEIGIEVPEDKKEAFDKAVLENYKTVKEVEQVREKLEAAEKDRDTYKNKYDTDIAQRDNDLATLKTQLEEAGQSKEKLTALQQSLTEAQEKYNTDKANWEQQLADVQYDSLATEASRELKFSSKAAQKVFMDELKTNRLQVKDGNLLGFTDYVNVYKEQNPDSFLADEGEGDDHTPILTGKSNPADAGKGGEDDTPTVPIIW